jgi:hypothetical protein
MLPDKKIILEIPFVQAIASLLMSDLRKYLPIGKWSAKNEQIACHQSTKRKIFLYINALCNFHERAESPYFSKRQVCRHLALRKLIFGFILPLPFCNTESPYHLPCRKNLQKEIFPKNKILKPLF